MNRSPICPVLVDPTLVICPNVGAVTVVLGLFNCRQLNTLNDSKRNWICEVPRKVNVFANVRSTRRRPGPRTSEEFWLPGRIVAPVVAEVVHQRVRAAIEVLQRIAPVVEYLVAAVVIGPAVRNARRLGDPQRFAAIGN